MQKIGTEETLQELSCVLFVICRHCVGVWGSVLQHVGRVTACHTMSLMMRESKLLLQCWSAHPANCVCFGTCPSLNSLGCLSHCPRAVPCVLCPFSSQCCWQSLRRSRRSTVSSCCRKPQPRPSPLSQESAYGLSVVSVTSTMLLPVAWCLTFRRYEVSSWPSTSGRAWYGSEHVPGLLHACSS